MLFGAALVMFGVLVTALADRIRSIRIGRERRDSARELMSRTAPRAAAPIEVVEPAPVVKPERARAPRAEAKSAADDVIAALVAAGYKKPVAAEAVWGCSAAERETPESWAQAALRRCARGGMS
jgi:hypothetical protein